MGRILGQDQLPVSLSEDQHPVSDLGPGGEHEPLRKSVRPRTSGRDLHWLDTGAGQGRIERIGELPSPVADQEPEIRGAVTETSDALSLSSRSGVGLLGDGGQGGGLVVGLAGDEAVVEAT